ncbi:MAG: SusC/RagA family TonB-linked outer membrane protein [Candidatus Dadabacteria bacterium]
MRKLLLLTMMLVLTGVGAWAQRTVAGKVTDASGVPVPGASILVPNTKIGTMSKEDGTFSLQVPSNVRVLMISAVGMTPQQATIGSNGTVSVSLQPASEASMQEVVVVGYGTQQKKAFTGSASKVNAQQISTLMTPSIDKELAGRATGVQVTNSGGAINAPARIRIRGINSLNQSNDPLIVVDGVPIITGNLASTTNSNAIADINPADIESIEVLKDGAALNIYGSRGAAGVIQITTKKGIRGQLRVNYDGFYGFSSVAKKYDLLNADEFVKIANEKLANANQAARAGVNPGGVNTDWQNEVLVNNAPVQNHNLSIQGGSNRTTYFLSLNYGSQQGTVKSNWNKAYRIRANIDNDINKFLRIGNNISLSRQEDADQNTGSNSLGGAIASTLRLLPNVSPYNTTNPTGFNINSPAANNIPNGPNSQGVDDNWFNIAFLLANNKYYSDKYRIIDNAYVELSPVNGLKLRSQFSYDMLNDYGFQAWDPRHGDGYSLGGLVYNADQTFVRSVWQNYLNYNLSVGPHNMFFTAGHEVTTSKTKWLSVQGTQISDLFFLKENYISNSASTPSIGGSFSKSGFQSVFARFNYDYKNRYFAQASFRRDGQSSLAPGKQYGNFPGFSVGWRPSEEGFWKSNGFLSTYLSDVKIKGSYATVGNTLGGLPYLSTFGGAPYGNISGIAINAIGNTELQWETSKKYDAGIEVGLFKRRINLTADWFLNDVNNLVLNVPTPLSAGIPGNSIPQNIGTLENRGIELAVDALVVNHSDFKWNLNVNFSSVHNKITNLYSIGGVPTQYINNGSYNIIRVGDPINILYGYNYAGVNTATGYPMYYKADGKLVMHNIPTGAYYYINDANDGNIVPANATSMAFADRTKLGEATPTWFGGVSNSFTYKQFGLDVMFRYSGGNKIMNFTRQEALLNQGFANNGREILERWQKPGDIATVPKLIWGYSNSINQNGLAISRFVEDGDYLRLQNVVLTYTVNPVALKWSNGYLKSARLYAQGQNLHVWTNYTGADPDNITTTGIDNPTLAPQIRTISFGINLGF